jgi:tetratricopeptide (TPR) repeat protein
MRDASKVSILVGRWLIPVCAGVLVGASLCAVAKLVFTAPIASQDSFGHGLMVTQQLNSLFNVVESKLQEDPSHLASYRKLLDTFLVYDRQYVEQASIDPATRLAKAYAARRMGHCCQAIGELEDSSKYYRQSRDLFASCLQADPNVIELYSLWLNTHTQIAYVEFARGDFGSAQNEYRAALRVLQESRLVPNYEYHGSLLPELESLAQLGIELKLYAEAMQVAERFALSARLLMDQSPHDSELAQDLADAEICLKLLSSLLRQQEN